jgi:hypothetical protein
LLGVFGALLLNCARSAAAGPVSILKAYVGCQDDDSVGTRLCYAVKKKLRASSELQLVVGVNRVDSTADTVVGQVHKGIGSR